MSPNYSTPFLTAHRGMHSKAVPENSLSAFRLASRDSHIDAIELDVQITKDGEPVVLHDASLKRTTTGKGKIRNKTLEEIRNVRLLNGHGEATDEPVPTLREALNAISANKHVYIEIKPMDTLDKAAREDALDRIVDAIESQRQGLVRCQVISFDHDVLRMMRQLHPAVRIGLSVDHVTKQTIDDIASTASQLGTRDVITNITTKPRHLEAMQKKGLSLHLYTCNSVEDIRKAMDLGAASIISDKPPKVERMLAGRGHDAPSR